MKLPTGFDTKDAREKFAQMCVDMIDAFDNSWGEKKGVYQLAQDVYDSKKTLSSLEFIEDATPYNVPLVEIRVDSLVENVCGTFASADPKFIVKGGGDEPARDATEHDVSLAFEQAKWDYKLRQIGTQAAIWSRGPFKVEFETTREGQLGSGNSNKKGKIRSAGLKITPIRTSRAIFYPTYAVDPEDALMIGEWSEVEAGTIREMIAADQYVDDFDPIGTDDSGITKPTEGKSQDQVATAEHAPVKVYQVLVKARPGAKDLNEYDEGEKIPPRRWYKAHICTTRKCVLWISEYDDPTPNYFWPTFAAEPDDMFSENSPASRLLEMQAVVNDAFFLTIIGGAQSAFQTVLASGFVADAQTVKLGIGKMLGFQGNPSFHNVPSTFNPQTIGPIISNAERYADGSIGASALNQGQELEGKKTATEASALMAADAKGMRAQSVMFSDELVRAADYARHLLCKNWKDWNEANKDAIQATSHKQYDRRYGIEVNGKTAGNNPAVSIEKLKMLGAAAKELGIQFVPPTKQMSADALFETILNALDIHVSTAKIVVDPVDQEQPIEAKPFIDPQSLLGQAAGGGLTPEDRAAIMAGMVGGGEMGMAAPPLEYPAPELYDPGAELQPLY
jgi:hypothetical protein